MRVTDLGEWRDRNMREEGGFASCVCGSGWFEIRLPDGPGAVCMNPDGTVTGYSGHPYCAECGAPWHLP